MLFGLVDVGPPPSIVTIVTVDWARGRPKLSYEVIFEELGCYSGWWVLGGHHPQSRQSRSNRDCRDRVVTIVTGRWGGHNLVTALFLTTSDELLCISGWWALGRHYPQSRDHDYRDWAPLLINILLVAANDSYLCAQPIHFQVPFIRLNTLKC
jgi:hypothetical protein